MSGFRLFLSLVGLMAWPAASLWLFFATLTDYAPGERIKPIDMLVMIFAAAMLFIWVMVMVARIHDHRTRKAVTHASPHLRDQERYREGKATEE